MNPASVVAYIIWRLADSDWWPKHNCWLGKIVNDWYRLPRNHFAMNLALYVHMVNYGAAVCLENDGLKNAEIPTHKFLGLGSNHVTFYNKFMCFSQPLASHRLIDWWIYWLIATTRFYNEIPCWQIFEWLGIIELKGFDQISWIPGYSGIICHFMRTFLNCNARCCTNVCRVISWYNIWMVWELA